VKGWLVIRDARWRLEQRNLEIKHRVIRMILSSETISQKYEIRLD